MALRRPFLRQGAFTLIELLVVILVIGILIAVAAPSFLGQTQKAEDSAAKQYLTVAYKAAKAYSVDGNGAPGHVQGNFDGFTDTVLEGMEPGLDGVMGNCPNDASGHEHNYIVIDTASANNLTICSDPDNRVWTLKVVAGVLQDFELAEDVPEGGSSELALEGSPVAVTSLPAGDYASYGDWGPAGIVFLRESAGLGGIYTINSDGTGLQSVTPLGSSGDTRPRWSPSGAKIAFSRNEAFPSGGSNSVYTINPNGSGLALVSPGPNTNFGGWVSDTRLIFSGDDAAATRADVYSVNADGSNLTALTSSVTEDLNSPHSAGGMVVFRVSSGDLYKLDIDGNGLAVLQGGVGFGVLSPDGSKIAYNDLSSGGIHVENLDGSGEELILDTEQSVNNFRWSPDGSKIAYDHSGDVWVVKADGSGSPLKVSGDPGFDGEPVWSPDSTKILYGSERAGTDTYNLYYQVIDG